MARKRVKRSGKGGKRKSPHADSYQVRANAIKYKSKKMEGVLVTIEAPEFWDFMRNLKPMEGDSYSVPNLFHASNGMLVELKEKIIPDDFYNMGYFGFGGSTLLVDNLASFSFVFAEKGNKFILEVPTCKSVLRKFKENLNNFLRHVYINHIIETTYNFTLKFEQNIDLKKKEINK